MTESGSPVVTDIGRANWIPNKGPKAGIWSCFLAAQRPTIKRGWLAAISRRLKSAFHAPSKNVATVTKNNCLAVFKDTRKSKAPANQTTSAPNALALCPNTPDRAAALHCCRARSVYRSAATHNCVGAPKTRYCAEPPLHLKTPRGRTVRRKTMGISGLHHQLKPAQKRIDVSELRGRTLAPTATRSYTEARCRAPNNWQRASRRRATRILRYNACRCWRRRVSQRSSSLMGHQHHSKGTRIMTGAPVATRPSRTRDSGS